MAEYLKAILHNCPSFQNVNYQRVINYYYQLLLLRVKMSGRASAIEMRHWRSCDHSLAWWNSKGRALKHAGVNKALLFWIVSAGISAELEPNWPLSRDARRPDGPTDDHWKVDDSHVDLRLSEIDKHPKPLQCSICCWRVRGGRRTRSRLV